MANPRFFDQAETMIDNLGVMQTLMLLAHVASIKSDRFSDGEENKDKHKEWHSASSDLKQLAVRIGRLKNLDKR